jgi:ubiquinone/menaquinone biosynthesis C-methylase UbiE
MPVSREILEHYEKAYSEENPVMARGRSIGAKRKAENIIALCESLPHDRVLEIGAGDGAVLLALKKCGFGKDLTALEISALAVKRIRALEIPGLSADVFDGAQIPASDATFDLAILSHVVEHLENPRQLLKEAARVAKHVFVEVPCEDTRTAGNDWRWNPEGHINYYTPRSIRFLVQSCRLRVHGQRLADWAFPTYIFEDGLSKGLMKFVIKRAAMPLPLSCKVFTYNCALVASQQN